MTAPLTALTPILLQNNTPTSTTSTTEVDLSRKTSALANGVTYRVFYYANAGGNDTDARPELNLRFGATGSLTSGTRLAHMIGEGRGTSDHWDSGQLQGVCRVTGDGTKVLGFTGSTNGLASDTCHVGACAIIAIPETNFPPNSLFFSGTDADADEVTNAATSGMTTIRTQDFTLPQTGDYLVSMSVEVSIDGSATTDGYLLDFREGASNYLNPGMCREEWEDAADIMSVCVHKIMNLSAGSHTFVIEGASQGSASCDFGRSRISVIRLTNVFDQWENITSATALDVTATTYGTSAMLSNTYAPNQQEYLLMLGSWQAFCSTTDATVQRIRNTTDSTSFCEDSGEYQNNAAEDLIQCAPIACEQISSSKTYEVQLRTLAGTGNYQESNTEARLLFIGLSIKAPVSLTPASAAVSINEQAPTVTGFQMLTISATWGADVRNDGTKAPLDGEDLAGVSGSGTWRWAQKWPVPDDYEYEKVELIAEVLNVYSSELLDVGPYNGNGQADPEADSGADMYSRCDVTSDLYLNDSNQFQSTGVKTLDLGAAAVTDVNAAAPAVGRFSVAARVTNEGIGAPGGASIREYDHATNPPKLRLTLASGDVVLAPASVGVSINEQAPTLQLAVAPASVAVTINEQAPSLRTEVQPASATLVIDEKTPVADTGGGNLFPESATLVIFERTPTLLLPVALAPAAAVLEIAEEAPLVDLGVYPAAASIAILGQAPIASSNLNFRPASVALTINGVTPQLELEAFTPNGVLVITGHAPVARTPEMVFPPTGGLLIVGLRPALTGVSIWRDDVVPPAIWEDVDFAGVAWVPDAPPAANWAAPSSPSASWTPAGGAPAAAWTPATAPPAVWKEDPAVLRARDWDTHVLNARKTEEWDIPTEQMTGGQGTVWTQASPPATTWTEEAAPPPTVWEEDGPTP